MAENRIESIAWWESEVARLREFIDRLRDERDKACEGYQMVEAMRDELEADNVTLRTEQRRLQLDYDKRCHDMAVLRKAMGCDGSDLPQLLAAWDALWGELFKLKKYNGEVCERLGEVLSENTVLRAERDGLKEYTATLEAECMAVTECAYALELTLNWAGNYGYDAKVVRHQEAKAEILYCDLFAARHEHEPIGVRLLREKNEYMKRAYGREIRRAIQEQPHD